MWRASATAAASSSSCSRTSSSTTRVPRSSAVQRAQNNYPGGFVYWAIPTRQGTRAGYGIYVLDRNNQTHYLFIS